MYRTGWIQTPDLGSHTSLNCVIQIRNSKIKSLIHVCLKMLAMAFLYLLLKFFSSSQLNLINKIHFGFERKSKLQILLTIILG